jgi:hypothetical protein
MSQKTLINFYLKKQKKSKARISDILSGRAGKSSAKKGKGKASTSAASTPAASTPAVEASTSTAASATSFVRRGESEMEDVIIESTTAPFTIGSDEESQPTRASKRRRTNTGSEEQHSDGNFQKISKNLIKIFYNI